MVFSSHFFSLFSVHGQLISVTNSLLLAIYKSRIYSIIIIIIIIIIIVVVSFTVIVIIIVFVVVVVVVTVTVTVIVIVLHYTHYQHSDWPRASAYFENLRDFVDRQDYSIICYPIICADFTAHCALRTAHLWLKTASTRVVLSDATARCVCPCNFTSTNNIYLHFTQ